MKKDVFVIHHPAEDAWAGQVAGELALHDHTARRAAALGRTERGRAVMAHRIQTAGVCLVLWTPRSCEDTLVVGQARHAVRSAVPSIAVVRGAPTEEPPLGLPVMAWSDDMTALVARVEELLAWEELESTKPSDWAALQESSPAIETSRWSRRRWAGVAATALVTVAAGGWWVAYGSDQATVGPTTAAAASLVEQGAVAAAWTAPSAAARPGGPSNATAPGAEDDETAAPPPKAHLNGDIGKAERAEKAEKAERAEKPARKQASLAGVDLPEGRVVQQLRIGSADYALHVSDKAVRLFQIFGPGAAGLRSPNAIMTQRADRHYVSAHLNEAGDVLLTVDRIAAASKNSAGERVAPATTERLRVAVWRRNRAGFWATWRVRFERVPTGASLTPTFTMTDERAETLVRWQRAEADSPAGRRLANATRHAKGVVHWAVKLPTLGADMPQAPAGRARRTATPTLPAAAQPAAPSRPAANGPTGLADADWTKAIAGGADARLGGRRGGNSQW